MESRVSAEIARFVCDFNYKVHPVSEMIMASFINGNLNQADFLRYFSLPNSDYISLAACFVRILHNGAPIIAQ